LDLKQTVAAAMRHLPHPDGDVEARAKKVSQFLRQIRGARRDDGDILRHPGLADVCIDGLRAEQNRVIAPAQKLEHGVLKHGQRQRLAHEEFPECKSLFTEHCAPPECARLLPDE
jgi:hypothetical protein